MTLYDGFGILVQNHWDLARFVIWTALFWPLQHETSRIGNSGGRCKCVHMFFKKCFIWSG